MYKEILTKKQIKLLPILKSFRDDFGLVGGTAIALYIGHRQSIDFDLFSLKEFDSLDIKRKLGKYKIENVIQDEKDEFSILINGVKITFLYYPFKISFLEKLNDTIKLPDLLTLSAMKAYALGRRAKWKDYVDMYFIIKDYHPLKKIAGKAKAIFGSEFNEKIFRTQLSYFKDINYSEKIMFTKGFEVSDKIIKQELIKFSLE